jgi:hypothetical protein
MTHLAEFFRESHTVLGVFYPLHYLVAVFPNIEKARHVVRDLVFTGFPADQAAAFDGRDFLEMERDEAHVWNAFTKAFSRTIDGEQVATDEMVDRAAHGAAFVMVHCPDEETKSRVWDLVEKADPVEALYYTRLGIDHIKSAAPAPAAA